MKTVSLTEALKSGKKFKWKICGDFFSSHDPKDPSPEMWEVWTKDAILNAECIIEQEPREIWLWEFNDGELGTIHKKTEQTLALHYPNSHGGPVKFREVIDEV